MEICSLIFQHNERLRIIFIRIFLIKHFISKLFIFPSFSNLFEFNSIEKRLQASSIILARAIIIIGGSFQKLKLQNICYINRFIEHKRPIIGMIYKILLLMFYWRDYDQQIEID